jgi:hypothetical protein
VDTCVGACVDIKAANMCELQAPLCHIAPRCPVCDRRAWGHYRQTGRFAYWARQCPGCTSSAITVSFEPLAMGNPQDWVQYRVSDAFVVATAISPLTAH